MTNSVPHNKEMFFLCQVLKGFFQSVGENRENIGDILRKFKELRKEYIKFLRDDVILGLVQSKGDGSIGENFSRERFLALLNKLLSSFRTDQDKSYQFLEQGICKDILEKISQNGLKEGLKELTKAKEQIINLTQDKENLQKECTNLGKSLAEITQRYDGYKPERESLQKQVSDLSKQVEELKRMVSAAQTQQEDLRFAIDDYESILKEVRVELEGKKVYDFWRLKVFYNRVASLINSDWAYPGVPKPDPFEPKSGHTQKFLDSLWINPGSKNYSTDE